MLEQAIEKKRKKMIHLADVYGYTSPKTIKCSQELDKLINIQLKIKKTTNFVKLYMH